MKRLSNTTINLQLIVLCTAIPFLASAQDGIFISGTVGQYFMEDMKDFQEDLQHQYQEEDFDMKSVTQFPVSLQVDVGYLFNISDDTFLGPFANYAVTKGRLHYSDYSGEMYADQNLSRIVVGVKGVKHIGSGFGIYGKAGLNYSMLEFEFGSTIYGAGQDASTADFYSIGGSLDGGFSWGQTLGRVRIDIYGGFEVNMQGKTYFKEESEAYLLDSHGNEVKINWTGLRTGIGLFYSLGK